jgi:hypothetical protein
VTDAFYERLDEHRYRATASTAGPWDPGSQHAGPPSALLGRVLEGVLAGPLARVTIEILRPVPVAELTVTAEMLRPGRSVRLAQGTLADGDGPVMLARGWTIRRTDVELPASVRAAPEPAAPPAEGTEEPFFEVAHEVGYHTAMEMRFLHGSFREPGPASAWLRARVPMVDGEALTPLERVLLAADTGNGVSAWFDPRAWLFINTDLTVHLHRYPGGEWVHLDAHTTLEPDGVGLASTVLGDESGPFGRGLQSLLVGRS